MNMLNKEAQLVENIFEKDSLESASTRDGFGRGVVEAGEVDENVVLLCADLAESTRSHWFKEQFPERYIEMGVAEQNLATVASGLAAYGKIPFITSYAAFSPGRNNEQIRTTISLNNVPVKICGMHAGVSVGPDGATHQQLEDVALMQAQPNMTVVVPCDVEEARKATVVGAKKLTNLCTSVLDVLIHLYLQQKIHLLRLEKQRCFGKEKTHKPQLLRVAV